MISKAGHFIGIDPADAASERTVLTMHLPVPVPVPRIERFSRWRVFLSLFNRKAHFTTCNTLMHELQAEVIASVPRLYAWGGISIAKRGKRCVVCAANRTKDVQGRYIVVCAPRHYDEVMHMTLTALPYLKVADMEQGFVDQRGVFMDRAEAFEVATAAGQIIEKTGNPNAKILFSEDLY